MSRRRRRSDQQEKLPFWRKIRHDLLYSFAGFMLGLSSPLGAFFMRYWMADPILKMLWVRHELQYNSLFYAYMGIGSVASFTAFGYFLGLRSEVQRVNSRVLSARIDELHIKSVTDGLTGAYTHGYLQEILEIEIQHSLTHKTPISLMILDIDDFKKVNDSHGHLFGDRVIKETAEAISSNIRTDDILGRYGGDEFLVIMPGADRETSLQIAERIRLSVAKNGYLATVSIGTTTFTGQEKIDGKGLLSLADSKLYTAKREGKNKVGV